MALNLCIDIGNSRIKMALFENDVLIQFSVFEHNDEPKIKEWLANKSISKGIYSSVIKANPAWLYSIHQKDKLIKLDSNIKTPLKNHYKTPLSLGTDRVAAMVGAISQFPSENLLVVNAGSCVTFDLVDKNHVFIGGNIAPGLGMRWKAMHQFTANLPRVLNLDSDLGFLGNTTMSALHNGGFQGIVMEIEGYFDRLKQDNADLKCIITGGTAPFLVNQLKIDNFAEPYLVLKGLNNILNYQ